MNLMTIMYICIQETLNDPVTMQPTHLKLRMATTTSRPLAVILTPV
jgi:hypothetical protein